MTNSGNRDEVKKAFAELGSPDRNMRIRALRRLAQKPDPESAVGILTGLGDPKRRVRNLAVKLCPNFFFSPEIVAKVKELSENPSEKKKIRAAALMALVNAPGTARQVNHAIDAVNELLTSSGLRPAILLGLLQRDLNPSVKELLQTFVKDGSKEEAVAATRALCGYRVVNLGSLPDEETRAQIRSTCELAAGSVFYWVPRSA